MWRRAPALLLVSIIIIFRYSRDVSAWRTFTLQFKQAKCEAKSELVAFINCSIKPNENKKLPPGLSLNLAYAQDIKKLRMDFMLVTTRVKQPDFVLVNVTNIDGCEFLAAKGVVNILRIVRREFSKWSNLPKACPIKKDYVMEVKNLFMDENQFPPYFPETTFKVYSRLYEDTTPLFTSYILGVVELKRNSKQPR